MSYSEKNGSEPAANFPVATRGVGRAMFPADISRVGANGAPRTTRNSVREKKLAGRRGLLALDGRHLAPEVLTTAQERCIEVADRLDILLVNPPAAPTSLLQELLINLEQRGIDYRLTSVSGDFGEQIRQYLRRFLGITMVIVDALPLPSQTWNAAMTELCRRGYHFITLSDSKVAA
jgi:hypothetical protein